VEKFQSCNVEKSFVAFLEPDLEADDFKILTVSSMSKDMPTVKFSCRSDN